MIDERPDHACPVEVDCDRRPRRHEQHRGNRPNDDPDDIGSDERKCTHRERGRALSCRDTGGNQGRHQRNGNGYARQRRGDSGLECCVGPGRACGHCDEEVAQVGGRARQDLGGDADFGARDKSCGEQSNGRDTYN